MSESNLGVVVLAQQIKDGRTAQAIAENWKMSTAEVRQLRWTVDMRDLPIDLDWCKANIVASEIHRDWIYDLLRVREDWNLLDQVKQWETPVFPINGNDLIDHGYKPGPGLGHELMRRKQWWINSDYTMTRNELLEIL